MITNAGSDMRRDLFIEYIKATNVSGSQKAASYIRALDILNLLITHESFGFDDCRDVWNVNSIDRLHQLYLFVLQQSKIKENNLWHVEGVGKSYLGKGFCSAALSLLIQFLIEFKFEQRLLISLEQEEKIIKVPELSYPDYLLEDLDKREGLDILRQVKVRTNQNVFRSKILQIYNGSCCITGLNIPDINRASHIVPWVEEKTIRLDPANGLCLSATYDAAFDKHLISLDEDHRLILSKDIKDFYTSVSVNEYFIKKEGLKINLPNAFIPKQAYLEIHRKNCNF